MGSLCSARRAHVYACIGKKDTLAPLHYPRDWKGAFVADAIAGVVSSPSRLLQDGFLWLPRVPYPDPEASLALHGLGRYCLLRCEQAPVLWCPLG